jgi:hypothetical protein
VAGGVDRSAGEPGEFSRGCWRTGEGTVGRRLCGLGLGDREGYVTETAQWVLTVGEAAPGTA